jgi:NAD(P)-dependent dehydrogenase (short-subunit alcohol dehydrogenase family)
MLDDITAFVTGASQGIGRTIAETMAEKGASVALAARNEEALTDLAATLPDDRALAVPTDVTDEASVEAAIAETVDTFGGLDCLVNNAGIAGPTAPVEEVSRDEWARTMGVNVTGPFLCAKHAAPYLRESDRGSVVNLASITGKRPQEQRTPYTTSKMAVIGLTRTLALELGTDDVTVNAVCPGATRGPRIDSVIEKQADRLDVDFETAKREVFTDDTALGTMVDPDDIASMVVYLASAEGRHISGQDINVDGGSVWY